jgi:hypothetical protein
MRDICIILLAPRDNKTTIKGYQNQSIVSNQAGRDPLPFLAKPPEPKVTLWSVALWPVTLWSVTLWSRLWAATAKTNSAGKGKTCTEELPLTFNPRGDIG